MKKWISPVAIDMGAKNTATFFTHYTQGEEPLSTQGKTFCIDTTNFTISLKDRLANRHRMRGEKRRKLAKRLFFLILEKEFGLKQDSSKVWEFIRGLFNRRGFTFLSEDLETQEEEMSKMVPLEVAKYFFPDEFKGCEEVNTLDYLKLIASEDLDEAKKIWKSLEKINLKDNNLKENIKKFLKDYPDSYQQKEVEDYLKALRDLAENLNKQIVLGNKPRKLYFQDIYNDIQNHSELSQLLKNANLPTEKFYRLVAHISNLQLRILRKYFHDKTMKDGDYWDDARLKRLFLRYVRSWHTKNKEEKENKERILNYFKENDPTVLDFFLDTNVDPLWTIPPYEDQNNRNIPHCQSLLLNAEKLDKKFGNTWKEITKKLTTDGKGEILEFYDKNNIQKVYENLKLSLQGEKKDKNIPFDKDSILLQRVLETHSELDQYHLRIFVKGKTAKEENSFDEVFKSEKLRKKFFSSIESLKTANSLNDDEIETLFKIAKEFYQNISDARLGIWDEEDSLLSKCNSKTSHKNKTQKLQVEQILRIQFQSEEQFQKFLEEVWHGKITGKSTARTLCEKIEETRKSYSNSFAYEYKKVLNRYRKELAHSPNGVNPTKSDKKSSKTSEDKKEEKLYKLPETVTAISKKIFSFLKENQLLQEADVKKDTHNLPFSNPFSLAQLYNILETERHGFNKICKACILENSWRSRREISPLKKEVVDYAVRLSADTGRPFDGQIDKILSRLAWEIGKAKFKQIQAHFQDGESLEIPILLEYNQFNFTEQTYELKRVGTKSKRWKNLEFKKEKSESLLKSKEERIKEDSKKLCAYTGKTFTNGEIDHILPRSYTIDKFGTILNSEINLLYVSRDGNRQKAEQEYKIENINQKFLQEYFDTTDKVELRKKIQEVLNKVTQENQRKRIDYLQVESLESQYRLLLKLGLFYPDLREEILKKIQTHSRTLVNGTQVWLFKKLKETLKSLLKKHFPNSSISIFPHYIGTRDDEFSLSTLRKLLGDYNPAYQKPTKQDKEGQKETSHIIDATLVFAKALIDQNLKLRTPLIPEELTPEWLESLLPEDLEIVQIYRKPFYRKSRPFTSSLFKAGMYAERFLSLLVFKDKVKVGFTPELSEELDSKAAKKVFDRLKIFLKHGKDFVEKDLEYYQTLETPMRYVLLKIDRQKAKEYLHSCKSDDLIGQTLEGLRYITQNKKVLQDDSKVIEVNDKGFSADFWIPKAKGKFSLTLPFKQEWEKLQEKLKGIDSKDKEKLRETAKEFFHQKNENLFEHKAHPQKLSLPIKTSPPSGGFRILRKNPFREKIFQVHTTSGHYIGFAVEDNKINFKKSVMSPIFLQNSISVYTYKDKQNTHSKDQIVMFDEWRELPLQQDWKQKGIQAVFIKLATQDRRDVKIVVDITKILSSKQKNQLYELKNIFTFKWKDNNQDLNKDDLEFIKKLKEVIKTIDLIPNEINSKTKMVKVSITKITPENITLAYRSSNSFPEKLQTLYNQGKKVESP